MLAREAPHPPKISSASPQGLLWQPTFLGGSRPFSWARHPLAAHEDENYSPLPSDFHEEEIRDPFGREAGRVSRALVTAHDSRARSSSFGVWRAVAEVGVVGAQELRRHTRRRGHHHLGAAELEPEQRAVLFRKRAHGVVRMRAHLQQVAQQRVYCFGLGRNQNFLVVQEWQLGLFSFPGVRSPCILVLSLLLADSAFEG